MDEAVTEGRTANQWLRQMYSSWVSCMRERVGLIPDYDTFWAAGAMRLPRSKKPAIMLHDFRMGPQASALKTPSGKIELVNEQVAGFGYAAWLEPAESLGAERAKEFPLHMLSDQPPTKLHSQLDFSVSSLATKVKGREPIMISVADAKARGIADGDIVRVLNERGSCLAGAVVTVGIMPGVVKLSTGAWWDPERAGDPRTLDRHGNPNSLTRDVGASNLSQGCAAQTCLVQLERLDAGESLPMEAFDPPNFSVA